MYQYNFINIDYVLQTYNCSSVGHIVGFKNKNGEVVTNQ